MKIGEGKVVEIFFGRPRERRWIRARVTNVYAHGFDAAVPPEGDASFVVCIRNEERERVREVLLS